MSSNYWSSTTNANNSDNAWNVNFNNGNVNNNNKSNNLYVRAVRGGKCSLLSFESVYNAYLDCRKRKRGTINALKFETGALEKLFDLALALQRGTYRPARSVCFVTTSPKLREIFAADFTDRIVHHLVVRELEKIWEPRFIHDSYASRKEKGTHGAVHRLQNFMLAATKNGKLRAWMVQLDIRSFFMSIDKEILFGIFERELPKRVGADSNVLLYLLHRIVYHACERDFVFRGNPAMLDRVPPHKSLLKVGEGKGLPIGNLTSQFFANVYLNELDHFIKHELKCRHYVRYVDDFILLAETPDTLTQWVRQIGEFLERKLLLTLKEGWRVKAISEGADFLGYIVRPRYILVRNRVVHAMKKKLAEHYAKGVNRWTDGEGRTILKMKMDPDTTRTLMQTVASYLGHFKHANSFSLKQAVLTKYPWLNEYFVYDGKKLRRKLLYQGEFRSFKAQVSFFRAMLRDTVLLVQVGLFMELYDDDAITAGEALGLSLQQEKRGMKFTAGFPLRFEKRHVATLLNMGKDVAVIREGGAGIHVKERYVEDLYRF
jgi:RNA-directed DNA polymerase